MAFTAQSDKRTKIFYWRRQERGSSLLPLLWLERPLQADAMGGRCTGSSSRATHSLISQVCCSPGSGTFRSEASAVHGERRRHRALIPSSPVTSFHGHPRRRFNSHMLSVHSRESIQWPSPIDLRSTGNQTHTQHPVKCKNTTTLSSEFLLIYLRQWSISIQWLITQLFMLKDGED